MTDVAPNVTPPAPSAPLTEAEKAADREKNRDLAALSYIWIFSVIVYMLKAKDSAFIQFHGRQGMVLFVISILAAFIPIFGALIEILVLAGCIWGFLLAAQGMEKEVPFIGPLARGKLSLRESWKSAVDGSVAAYKQGKDIVKNAKPNPPPPPVVHVPPANSQEPAVYVDPTPPPTA